MQSVVRSVEILEAVARSQRGLTLGELAESLGLKRTTAHNLIWSLVARGYLEKLRRPIRFDLGPALIELAAVRRQRSRRRQAADAIRALSSALPDATLTYVEHVGGEIQAVLRMSPERPGVLEEPQRQVMAPYTSASSLLYQAYWVQEERDAYRRRHPFDEQGAGAWGSADTLDAFLKTVRKAGHAMPPALAKPSFRAAAPVFTQTNELAGALGVSLADTDEHQRIIQALKSTAQALGQEMT